MIRLFLIACIWLLASDAAGQSWYETYTGWAVSTEPVLPAEERHPSIWFSAADVEALRAKRQDGDYAAGVWRSVEQEISRFRSMSIGQTTPNNRPQMAKVLAFAWVMNEDRALLDKAVATLRTSYDDVPRMVPKDGEYRLIYRATWFQNYLAAYDWVQPELSADEDADIRARLIEEAQLIRDNLVEGIVYSPRPHNHRSKPAWALGSAALTLSDHDQAADWLQHALELSNTVTRYQFSFDGIYREGGHYHVYNLVNLIPFLWHYKNVSGVDLFRAFAPGFEWPVAVRLHSGSMPNIEDSFIKPMPTHMVAAAYGDRPTKLHSSSPLAEVLQWAWMNTENAQGYTGATVDDVWEIDEFITFDPSIALAEPDIPPTVRLESGQIAFRDAWSSEGHGNYLLFHGVAAADNHNHPDNLSYFVESHGALLAVDAGYGRNGFSDANRAWYTSSEAHNLVTINNVAPSDFGFNEGPVTNHFLSTSRYDFAEMEARIPFRSGNTIRRGIAFPNKQYWVVYDLMYSDGDVDYRLNVHGRSVRVSDVARNGNQISWTTPPTRGRSARLHGYFFASEPSATLGLEQGITSLAWGHSEAQHYAQMYQRADTAAFLHLLFPSEADEEAPEIEDMSGDGVLAFEVGSSSLFAARTTNHPTSTGPMSTDASFAWAEHTGETLSAYSMTRGRAFGWGGRTLMEAGSAVTVAAEVVNGSVEQLTFDEVAGAVEVSLLPAAGRVYTAVTRGGEAVDFEEADGGAILFVGEPGATYVMASAVGSEARPPLANAPTLSVFPNPFSERASFRYEVPESGHVTVHIYDTLGRLVATPVDALHAPGTYHEDWMATAAGLYLFQMRLDDAVFHTTGIMIR